MSAAHEHRDGAECEHCESQPSALQRAFAAAVVFVAQPVVIRGIVVGGTLFCTLAWFQLPSQSRTVGSSWCIVALVMITLASFVCTILTDPGRVPSDWRAPGCDDGARLRECENEASLHHRNRYACRVRYCVTCAVFKPPRAHHCSACKRCVLRMSHHCSIAASCVGLFNLKQYFLWLLYTCIGSVISMIGLAHRIFWDAAPLAAVDWWTWLLALAINVCFAPTCVIMLMQTFFGLIHNNTKIEIWERHWAVVDAQKRGDTPYQYPYERGTSLGNLVEVFGTNPLAWCLPVYTGLVTGLDYGVLVPISSAASKAPQTV